MSKMSQLHAELTEQANELGFKNIEEAEARGYTVKYSGDEAFLVPDIDQAFENLTKETEAKREAKQIEMVWEALNHAKKAIALIYKDENEPIGHPDKDIKDKKIQSYYYTINEMCVELADRNTMVWQKEDENENQD